MVKEKNKIIIDEIDLASAIISGRRFHSGGEINGDQKSRDFYYDQLRKLGYSPLISAILLSDSCTDFDRRFSNSSRPIYVFKKEYEFLLNEGINEVSAAFLINSEERKYPSKKLHQVIKEYYRISERLGRKIK